MSLAVVVSWYLCGACAAGWMVRRGHSSALWWISAALLGALVWTLALPVSMASGTKVRWSGEPTALPATERLVVALIDGFGDVARTSASAARPGDHLVIVDRIGFESGSSLVDTGEREASAERTEVARRHWPGRASSRVASGPAIAVAAEAAGARAPDLVVRGAVTGWSWRDTFRQSISLGEHLGCPVLHAPVARIEPAPLRPMGQRA